MSIQRTSTSSFPSTPQWKYDVFLSFRGYDTRRGFTHNLYTALDHEGIRTFMDEPKLRKGEVISPALLAAIEESRIAIIVLSKNYASSTWCLDELVRILECMTARETVLPIFYDVEPSDIRKQAGIFGEAFANHEERFRDDKEKLLRWRSALTEVASFSGWDSNDERYEAKLISNIVKDIQERMPHISFGYAENLVGMDRILQPVYLHLGGEEDDVRFIGISGMGGIGKTTMVRAVHDKISHKFEFSFLLTNVRDSVEKGSLLNLQKQLLSGMIQTEQANRIFDLQRGATTLQTWLRGKKVLLILDDVSDSSHLKYLAGNQEWFGLGSRVLITTRNEHLLIEHGMEKRLKAEVLKDDDSLQLFSLKAFKRGYPEEDFLDLSVSVIEYAQGLPLALEVLGSSLYGRDRSAWDSKLSQLAGRELDLDIFGVLKISYDDLDPNEKKIFLDIACFFNGQDKRRVTDVLNSCDVSAKFGIDVLMERSLLSDSYGRLRMHDLLREMGQNIVRLEDMLGRRSRLWLFEDVRYVLTKNTGTEAIEGIFLDSTESSGAKIDMTPKSFSMMRKLRYLKIHNANLLKGLEYLPDSLRILDWTRYPLKSLPAYFNPQKLWELNLCHSCIEHVQIGKEPLYNLKTVNLSHSLNLVTTPNFKDMPYLEVVSLEGCIRLYEVDQGIEVLGRLSLLNLKDCKNLVHFASSVCALKSLKVLNLSGCSNLKKLPNDMDHLESLEKLDLSGSGIREVPSSIGLLKNLKELSLAGCKARSIKSWNMMFNPLELLRKRNHTPVGLSLPCLSGLHSLTDLNLSDCNLSEEAMPDGFGCLASLRKLNLRNNQFVSLPKSICLLSRLESLYVQGCHKLRVLPEFGSDVLVDGSNCISLESLSNQIGQCNSVLGGNFMNCFKMMENESSNSLALAVLARFLESEDRRDLLGTSFIGPGNEIPEWYSHQSVGSSVIVKLHPGWSTENYLGVACGVVFYVKPLPSFFDWSIECFFTANEQLLSRHFLVGQMFVEEWGHPVLDHIWSFHLPRNYLPKALMDTNYQLEFSFLVKGEFNEEVMPEVKKCGVRMIYENDVKELQTLVKQTDTKPGLQIELNNSASTMHDPVVKGDVMSLEIPGGSHPSSSANLKPRFGEPVKDHQLHTHSKEMSESGRMAGNLNTKGNGKAKVKVEGKTYLQWNERMDRALADVLREERSIGHKGDGGWKAIAYNTAASILAAQFDIQVIADNIKNRVKSWKKFYGIVSDILSQSGFSWDSTTQMINVDETSVWEEYVQSHKDATSFRYKRIPNWDDIVDLYGKDRATGEGAETGIDSTEVMTPPPNEVDQVNLENDDNMWENIEIIADTPPSGKSQRKRPRAISSAGGPPPKKRVSTKEVLSTSVDRMASSFEDLIRATTQCLAPKEVWTEIIAIPDLSLEEQIKASAWFIENEK